MKIAVVIPALDESVGIVKAIESASAPDVEVVVVDGGSADGTGSRAQAAGARVVESAAGRGMQLQAGVAATTGDPIVFLHADTLLPRGWEAAIRIAIEDDRVSGGAFRFAFDRSALSLGIVECGVRLRVALFSLPYGDQAIFVRRRVLEAIGGVPDVPVMEDLDLVTAIKDQGELAILDLPVATSARRYMADGVLRTVARHALAVMAWRLGVDRKRIEGWLRE